MHIYVKFLEGPARGQFSRVTSSKFKHNLIFNDSLDVRLKYPVQHKDNNYYKAQIVCFDTTEEKLETKICKRRKGLLPMKNLETASEDDESVCRLTKSKSETYSKQSGKKKNFAKFATIMNMDQSTLKELTNSNAELNKESEPECPRESSSQLVSATSASKSCNTLRKSDEKLSKINDKASESAESTSQKHKDKQLNKSSIGLIDANNELQDQTTCEKKLDKLTLEYEKLKKKIAVAEKNIDELKKENKKLKNKSEVYKKKAEEANKEREETLKRLNALVDKVIDKFEEKQVIEDQLAQTKGSVAIIDIETNFLPVGHYRPSDNTVSIGRGERLSRGVYDNIMSSKTPLQCAGNAVMAVFGETILIKSTVTGRVSGRAKAQQKNSQTLKGEQTEKEMYTTAEFQPLDPTKLSACEDLFSLWIKSKYSIIIMANDEEWQKDKTKNENSEIKKFRSYVTKKISYLKRPAPEKKLRVRKDSENSEHDAEATLSNQEARSSTPKSPIRLNVKAVVEKFNCTVDENIDQPLSPISIIAPSECSENSENKELSSPEHFLNETLENAQKEM